MTAAKDLPDGTHVEYDGEVFTAFPETVMAGTRFRWHSETMLASDQDMDRWLADGTATVVGHDEAAVAEYRAIMSERGQ